MAEITKDIIAKMIGGTMSWDELVRIMRAEKEPDRFTKYLEVIQGNVKWTDKILLPLSAHLYIVEKEDGSRIVKCDCGLEFSDYRENWKLEALVYVRSSQETIKEIYPEHMGCNPQWMELREYYCPGCKTQLDVEAVPPGYPIVFNFLPDLEGFYEHWLEKPLE